MPPEMVLIPAGAFRMGSDTHYPEEAPAREVSVEEFRIDRNEVTNAAFADFVDDTGYVTVAERPLDPADFPGAPASNLVPGSLVFTMTPGPVDLRHLDQWWTWTPRGSGSSPHTYVAHSIPPRAARSHSASVGSDLPAQPA